MARGNGAKRIEVFAEGQVKKYLSTRRIAMTSPIGGNVSKEYDVAGKALTSLYTNKTTSDAGAGVGRDQDT